MHRIYFMLAVCLSLPAADKAYVLKAAHLFDGKSEHVVVRDFDLAIAE